jgi:2-hydroxychromene-2-carboxylate isomerase
VVITDEILHTICTDAGLPDTAAAACITAINSTETKAALKESVGEAVGRGAFGAPFMCTVLVVANVYREIKGKECV